MDLVCNTYEGKMVGQGERQSGQGEGSFMGRGNSQEDDVGEKTNWSRETQIQMWTRETKNWLG